MKTIFALEDFIYPMFVVEGENIKNEVSSMPGVFQFSLDHLKEEMDEVASLGIKSVLLFGVPNEKDECGTGLSMTMESFKKQLVLLKKNFPEIVVIADTCFVNIQAMAIVESLKKERC